MADESTKEGSNFRIDFMILGAQKCGTTTLKDLLVTHDKLVCCLGKEPQFFAQAKDWKKELAGYHELYKKRDGALYFEASTTYTMYPLHNLEIWNDLYEYNPNLKFMYIVRPPLERVVSAYMHMYERGWTDLPFDQALFRAPSILWTSKYYQQIIPFIEKFGHDRIKILFLSDLKSEPDEFRQTVADFIGIDCTFSEENFQSNVATKQVRRHRKFDQLSLPIRFLRKILPGVFEKLTQVDRKMDRPKLSAQQKRVVSEILEDDIQKFEDLTNRNLSHWRATDG